MIIQNAPCEGSSKVFGPELTCIFHPHPQNGISHSLSLLWHLHFQKVHIRWFILRHYERVRCFALQSQHNLNEPTDFFSYSSWSVFDCVTTPHAEPIIMLITSQKEHRPHFLWVMNHGICWQSDMWHLKNSSCGFKPGWETTTRDLSPMTGWGATYVNAKVCYREMKTHLPMSTWIWSHQPTVLIHTLPFMRWENESVSGGIWDRIWKCLVGCKYRLCCSCSHNFISVIHSVNSPV